MNELMITLLNNNYYLYAACASAGLGSLIQLLLSIVYNRSLEASERMRSTKITWLRQMKTRYESGIEWDHRIRNVELFVDKNIGRRKLMGVYLKTWEELSRIMLPLIALFSLTGALCAVTYQEEKTLAVLYLAEGAVLIAFLCGLTAFANIKEKRALLKTNLCDYFENTLRVEAGRRQREGRTKKEQEFRLSKQQMEIACTFEENREGEPEHAKNETAKQETVETTDKSNTGRKMTGMCGKKRQRQVRRQEKQSVKLRKKEDSRIKKQEKKSDKEAGKLYRRQRKEQKRVEKLTKRMEKMQQRLGVATTAEMCEDAMHAEIKMKDESARLKREQLKQKVNVSPAQEDQIISEVLREFLA